MRKGISILLLGCFLVYHFGFYIFYLAYQHHIESVWTHNVFDEQSVPLRTLEIPMRLPYMIDNEEFHQTNISFSLDGKSYRGVKKRFINDAFQLLYVPDHAKVRLQLGLKQWVLSITPENSGEQQKDVVLSKNPVKDCLTPTGATVLSRQCELQRFVFSEEPNFYLDPIGQVLSPPPNLG